MNIQQRIRWIAGIAALALLPCSASAKMQATTGVHVNLFSDDQDDASSGTEVTFPFGLWYGNQSFTFSFNTSQSNLAASLPENADETIATTTDTAIGASYRLPKCAWGAACSFGLTLNLPTGKERLSASETATYDALPDELLNVSTLGEGLNIGGSFNVSKTFSDVTIGVNALYVFKGEYDPTSDASDDDKDPGDLISLTGLTQWKLSPAVMLMPMLTYSHTGVERINGAKNSQDGDVWSVSGAMRYDRPPFEFGASLRHILTRPNQEWREDALREEAANSNAQKWGGAVSVAYQPSPKWMIGLTGDVGYDTESDRRNETSGLPYDGRQTRYSLTPRVSRQFTNRLGAALSVTSLFITEEANIETPKDTSYWGVAPKFTMSYAF